MFLICGQQKSVRNPRTLECIPFEIRPELLVPTAQKHKKSLTSIRAEQVLERTGLPDRLFEAEDVPHVTLHPGKVESLVVDLLRCGEQTLRAGVIQNVSPILGAL